MSLTGINYQTPGALRWAVTPSARRQTDPVIYA